MIRRYMINLRPPRSARHAVALDGGKVAEIKCQHESKPDMFQKVLSIHNSVPLDRKSSLTPLKKEASVRDLRILALMGVRRRLI